VHLMVPWMILEDERRDAVAEVASVLKNEKQPSAPIFAVLAHGVCQQTDERKAFGNRTAHFVDVVLSARFEFAPASKFEHCHKMLFAVKLHNRRCCEFNSKIKSKWAHH